MFIQFDKQSMHVQVLVGILEKYQPNQDVKKIYSKVSDLKQKMDEFMKTIVHPEVEEIERLVKEENEKQIKKHSKK